MKTHLFFTTGILIIFSFAMAQAQRPATSLGGLRVEQTTAGSGGDSTSSYFGHQAGKVNTAKATTFIGYRSGFMNSTGWDNTAVGHNALSSNTTGKSNTAVGSEALKSIKTGFRNTAVGYQSLVLNSGSENSGFGNNVLLKNTTGSANTATGCYAMASNTSGENNTSLGYRAMAENITGNFNVAIGDNSLVHNTLGNRNTALGSLADVTADNLTNATAVGYSAVVSESNAIQLGNADVTKVYVGVGATATVYAGKVMTENIRCRMQSAWPDFVFESTYKLPSLSETEHFIVVNGHLPNIPNAATVAKEGIDLADMNSRLLEKIEQITLYLIELDHKDTARQKEINLLKAENEALKAVLMNSKTEKK